MSIKNPIGWTRDFHYWSGTSRIGPCRPHNVFIFISFSSGGLPQTAACMRLIVRFRVLFVIFYLVHTFSFCATAPCM